MANQFINFATSGSTGDTNDKNAASIRPFADGEAATASVFNRPLENLRARTELFRAALNDLKYLTDADRAVLLSGGGTITWHGPDDGALPANDGIFTTTADVVVRPFMSLLASQRAALYVNTSKTVVIYFNTSGPHAYEGSNEYTVTFVPGVSFGVAVSGTPANDITVTVVSPTTANALVTQLNANPTFQGLGLTAFSPTSDTSNIYGTTGNLIVNSPIPFKGGMDAERHIITPSAFATFFSTPANVLLEGDVLAIYYDALYTGTGGGRREAVPDYGAGAGVNNTAVGVSGSLFNLRVEAHKAPLAIPLATVENGNLVWINQVSIASMQTLQGLSAGFVQRAGDTMLGPLALTPEFMPATTGVLFHVTVPDYQVGTTPVVGSQFLGRLDAKTAAGLQITKGGGTGRGLEVIHSGIEDAVLIAKETSGRALTLTNTGNSDTLYVTTTGSGAAMSAYSSGAGPALVARSTTLASIPSNTVAFIAGPHAWTGLALAGSGATPTVGGACLQVTAPLGSTSAGRGIITLSAAGNGNLTSSPSDDYGVGLRAVASSTAPSASFVGTDSGTGLNPVTTVSIRGKPADAGQLLYITNTATASASDIAPRLVHVDVKAATNENLTGVLITTDDGAAVPLRIETNNYAETGTAAIIGGRVFIHTESGGTNPALTLSSTNSAVLRLTPKASAQVIMPGDVGSETYTANSITRARLRASTAEGATSGTRVTVNPGTGWNTALPNELFLWLDAEGIVHIRGAIAKTTGSVTLDATGLTATFSFSGVISTPYRLPTTNGPQHGSALALSGSDVRGCSVGVNSNGDLFFTNITGSSLNASAFLGVSLDYPLFS